MVANFTILRSDLLDGAEKLFEMAEREAFINKVQGSSFGACRLRMGDMELAEKLALDPPAIQKAIR